MVFQGIKRAFKSGLLALALSLPYSSAENPTEDSIIEKARRAMLPYRAQCELSNGSKYSIEGRGFLFNERYYLVPYHISAEREEAYLRIEERKVGKKLEIKETTYPIKEGAVNLTNSKLKFISPRGDADFHIIQLDENVARKYRQEKRFLTARPTKNKIGEKLYFIRGDGTSDDLMINPFTKKPIYETAFVSLTPSYCSEMEITEYLRNCESGTPFLDSSGNVRGFALSTHVAPVRTLDGKIHPERKAIIGDMNGVLKGLKGKTWSQDDPPSLLDRLGHFFLK